MKTARPPAGYLATHRLTPTASITGAGTLQEVSLTSVETASLQQRAAPSLTPPTARRHARLKELSEVSQTSSRTGTTRGAAYSLLPPATCRRPTLAKLAGVFETYLRAEGAQTAGLPELPPAQSRRRRLTSPQAPPR